MKLTFIGAGYVGLTSAAVFADLGHKVWVLDVDKEKIAAIKKGKAPFFEPGLDELVAKTVRPEDDGPLAHKAGNLIPTASYEEAIPEAEVIFICVGTPSDKDGETNLSYVFSAAESIGKNLGNNYSPEANKVASAPYTVVVVKSTVPPGTTERVGEIIRQIGKKAVGKEFDVVDCPEFLAEGSAVKDTLNPSRIVIGTSSEKPVKVLKKLFKPFKNSPTSICDIRSAELIKYASNAFLGTKISFINEVAQIAERVGADVTKVAEGMGLDDRIGPKFLRAGLGFGGSCFPKDIESLLSFSNHAGYEFGILRAANYVNQEQSKRFVEKIRSKLEGLRGKKIAVLGLAFKPETDDMRKAVSIEIIKNLLKEGAEVSVYDPMALANAKKLIKWPNGSMIKWAEDVYDALADVDCLALVTEWKEFADLDWKKVKKLMHGNLLADGRNFYDPEKMEKLGFDYFGMGRN